jgi:8-oxo-dGTP diphosphatase
MIETYQFEKEMHETTLAELKVRRKQPRVGVSLIVTRGDGRVLMGKRKGSHGAGKWSFPGGHLGHGERIHECAVRELREETGMVPFEVAGTKEFTNDIFLEEELHYITIFVYAKIRAGDKPMLMEPDKCEEWKWVLWNEMPPREELFLPIRNLRATGYRPPL